MVYQNTYLGWLKIYFTKIEVIKCLNMKIIIFNHLICILITFDVIFIY